MKIFFGLWYNGITHASGACNPGSIPGSPTNLIFFMNKLRTEFRERISGYVIGAFGLVASLAWNDAISAMIEKFFPLGKDTIIAKFIYALVMTVVLVIIAVYLVKLLKKDENSSDKK